MLIFLQLAAALVLVIVASDAFTNAVEWIGARFRLTRSATGAVVAAIGSSMPDCLIAITALLVFRDPRSQQIGIGAVLGSPLMLSTVVLFLMGVVALTRSRKDGQLALAVPVAPVLFGATLFCVTFVLALGASFTRSRVVHGATAIAVIVAYGIYLLYHLRAGQPEAEETPPPLRIAPKQARPSTIAIVFQSVVALGLTVFASRWFVISSERVADAVGIAPFVVSVFLSPIATELPEASNVVLWMRRKADSLAMGNVLGAMMFQTSVNCAIALLATPWLLSSGAYAAGAAALIAMVLLVSTTIALRRAEPLPLLACGLFYAAYVFYIARM